MQTFICNNINLGRRTLISKEKHTFEFIEQEFNRRGYTLITDTKLHHTEKYEYICPKHEAKGVQEISFRGLYNQGKGCGYCGREKSGKSRRIPESTIIEICDSKGIEFSHVDYTNKSASIYYICPEHRAQGTQRTTLSNLKKNKKCCIYCTGRGFSKDEVFARLAEEYPEVEVLQDFQRQVDRIKCRCKIHDVVHSTSITDILSGKGCLECGKEKLAKHKLRSTADFKQQAETLHPNIDVIGEYFGARLSVLCFCKIHRKEFSAIASSLTISMESGCDICFSENISKRCRKPHDQFIAELSERHPHIKALGEYITQTAPILLHCDVHNIDFMSKPVTILNNNCGCHLCGHLSSENIVSEILTQYGVDYVRQYSFDGCVDKRTLRFDYYIPSQNTAIEYQGEQHYFPVMFGGDELDAKQKYEYTKHHDTLKREFCEENNITLIEVPYWEKSNMESFLMERLINYK